MTKKDITSILNHCVRISNNSTPCGSGTIVITENEQYVITAKHCFENVKEEDIIIEFGKPFKKLTWSNVFLHPTLDIAIFKLESDQVINIKPIQIASFTHQQEFKLTGYPEGFNSTEKLTRNCKYSKNEDENDSIIRIDFTSQLETNSSSASNNTNNFSGGGIWSKENGKVYLNGIFLTHEEFFNTGTFVNIYHANELLKANSLEEFTLYFFDGYEIDPHTIIFNNLEKSLKEAEEWIETLFPKKAYQKLLTLKTEIELSLNIEQTEKDNLLSECNLLLGIATADLGKGEESDKYILKAHEIKPKEERYLERLPTIYFREKGIEETRKLLNKNLRLFPSNPRLWGFADVFLGETKSPPTMRNNVLYKLSTFISLSQVSSTNYISLELLNALFEKEVMLKALPPLKISRKEIYYWEALARYTYTKYLTLIPYHKLENYVEQFEKNDLLNYTVEILKRINNSIRGTEIEGKQNFFLIRIFYFHCQYLLTSEKSYVINLYNELSDSSIVKIVGQNIYEYIFCLLNINELDKVEELINRIDKEYHAHAYLAISQFLFSKKPDDRLKNYLLKYINEINEITEQHTNDLFFATENYIRLFEDIESILEIIKNKNFENQTIKDLVLVFILKFNRGYDSELYTILRKYESNFEPIPYSLKKNIVLGYYYFGEKIESWKLLNSYINKNEDSLELFLFLKISYELLNSDNEDVPIDGEEIFRLLKYWRENFRSNEELLGYELYLASVVNDYKLVVEVVKSGLQKFPQKLEFIISWISAIREGYLELTEDLKDLIKNKWQTFDFENLSHSIYFAEFCLEIQNKEIGLSIYYNLLKANPNSYVIKQEYFKVFANPKYELYEFQNNPHTVVEGSFVKLKSNGKTYIEEVNSKNLPPKLYNLILEKQKGVIVKIEKEIINSTFEVLIEDIYTPHLGFFYQIYEEIAEKPLMYDRFHILNYEEESDNLIEKMQSEFGAIGTERQIYLENVIEKFKILELGFTNLSRALNDPIYAHYFITSSKSSFFPTVPISLQKEFNPSIEGIEFVLDFSSILLLKHLEDNLPNLNLSQTKKYIISQAIIDFLNKKISDIEEGKNSELSLSVTLDDFDIKHTSQEYHQSQLTYYKSILTWITKRCKVEHPKSRVNIKLKLNRVLKVKSHEDDIFLSFVDCLLLSDNAKRVIISDDIDIFKNSLIGKGQLLTTEYYIKIFHSKDYNDCVSLMIDKNYRGVVINEQILTTAYELDPLLNKLDGRFFNIINNSFSSFYNPDNLHFLEVLKFIKKIYNSNINLDFKRHISQTILRALFIKKYINGEGIKLGLNFVISSFTSLNPNKEYIMDDIKIVFDKVNNSNL